jgi:hypothetical protein
MADSKVSSLTSASSLGAGDYLLLVQGGTSLKIDIQTFIQNLPVAVKSLEASETLAVAGAIATNKLTTKISAGTTGFTLAAGTNGMEKFIVTTGATAAAITVTGGAGFTTATFAAAIGNTVHLKNVDGLWYVQGTRNVTIA